MCQNSRIPPQNRMEPDKLGSTTHNGWVSKAPRVAKTKNGIAPRTCTVCQRPFEWRAKWKTNFEEVLYCSKKCARESRSLRKQFER
jgi:hypothetical protein